MSRPTLLSSVHGPIRRVLVTVPFWVLRYGHQVEIRPYRDALGALLRTLPARAERVVATHAESTASARALLDEVGVGDRSRVVTIADGTEFTVWAQDACVVQTMGDGEVRLLTPASFERHQDASVLRQAAELLALDVVETELIFQGGNVLVGDDFCLVGADAPSHTVSAGLAADGDDARARFSRTLAAELRMIVVGTDRVVPEAEERSFTVGTRDWTEHVHRGGQEASTQPLFDLDTFVSLAGRDDEGVYRLVVGDPRLAAEITGSPLPDHAIAEAFDDVAARLAGEGFRVVRNPLPLVYTDDPVLRTRHWYFATSNNVVAEVTDAGRRVWVPTYGDEEYPELEATDHANAALWEELGFSVEPLPTFHVFARGLGAARCISKVLLR